MPREIRIANASIGFFANIRQFVQNLGKVDKAIERQQRAMRRFRDTMRRTSRRLNTLRTEFVSFTSVLAAFGGTAGLSGVIREFLKFDDAVVRLESLIGLSSKTVQDYREQLILLSPVLARSPADVAEGLFFLASAGLRGDIALRALVATSKASAIGLGTSQAAAEALTSALGAWGTEALSVEQATSILIATVREGRFAPDELSSELGRLGALAAEVGVDFYEVGAALAFLSRSQDLVRASTGVRGLLSALTKPSAQAVDALEKVGFSVLELRKRVDEEGLLPTLIELRRRFEEAGIDLGKFTARVDALATILQLTGPQVESARQVFNALAEDSAAGSKALDDAFAIVEQSASFKLRSAFQRLNAVVLEFAQGYVPLAANAVKFLADNIAFVINAFSVLALYLISQSFIGRLIRDFLALARATLSFRFILGQLITTFTATNTRISAFLTRIRLVERAFIPLRVAFTGFYFAIQTTSRAIQIFAVTTVSALKFASASVRTLLLGFTGFAPLIRGLTATLSTSFVAAIGSAQAAITGFIARISGIRAVFATVNTAVVSFGARIVSAFAVAQASISGFITRILTIPATFITVNGIISAFAARLITAFTTASAGITAFITRVLSIRPSFAAVSASTRSFGAFLTSSFTTASASITAFVTRLFSIRGALAVASTAVQSFAARSVAAFATLAAAIARVNVGLIASRTSTILLSGAISGILTPAIVASTGVLKGFAAVLFSITRLVRGILVALLIFESIIFVVQLFGNLLDAAKEFGVSFSLIGQVAVVELIAQLLSGLTRLPGIFIGAFKVVFNALSTFVIQSGAAIGRALINSIQRGFGLEVPKFDFGAALGDAFKNSLAEARRTIVNDVNIDPLIPVEDIRQGFYDALELDPEEAITALAAVRQAVQETVQNLLDTLNFNQDTDIDIDFNSDALDAFLRNYDDALEQVDEDTTRQINSWINNTITQVEGLYRRIFAINEEAFGSIANTFSNFDKVATLSFRNVGDAALVLGDRVVEDLAKRFPESAQKLREEWAELVLSLDDNAERSARVIRAWLIETTTQVETAYAEIQRLNEQTVESMGEAFGQFATDVIKDFNDIGDAARRLAQEIVNALINRFITEPITNAATNAISKAFGGLLPTGSGGSIPGFQRGGVASGFGIVGEAGPEIIDFQTPTRVYTNDQLRAAFQRNGNNPVVNINMNVTSDNPEFVYQAIADATPALRDVIKTDLAVELNRQSALNTAVRGF